MNKGIGLTIIFLLVIDLAWRKHYHDCAMGKYDSVDKKSDIQTSKPSQPLQTNIETFSNW